MLSVLQVLKFLGGLGAFFQECPQRLYPPFPLLSSSIPQERNPPLKAKLSLQQLAAGGIIAALYIALTLAFAPISFSQIQFRIAEALSLLPVLSASSVPGLFIGCLTANLITGQPWQDVLFGALATLMAALLTRRFKKNIYVAALMPVVVNALVIGLMLHFVYGLHAYISVLTVGAGQAVVCYLLGVPLVKVLENRRLQLP